LRALNLAVAEGTPEGRESLRQLLTGLGHQVVTAEDTRQLAELCRTCAPDVVLLGSPLLDRDALAATGQFAGATPLPVILVADNPDTELPAGPETDFVLGYLVRPLQPAELRAALALARLRFGKLQALRQEAVALRREVITPDNGQALPRPKRRMLVVDDNRDAAASMAMMLKLLGDEVITAMTASRRWRRPGGSGPSLS
jgi:AmiR/NasT family two-component response regulator